MISLNGFMYTGIGIALSAFFVYVLSKLDDSKRYSYGSKPAIKSGVSSNPPLIALFGGSISHIIKDDGSLEFQLTFDEDVVMVIPSVIDVKFDGASVPAINLSGSGSSWSFTIDAKLVGTVPVEVTINEKVILSSESDNQNARIYYAFDYSYRPTS